MAFSFDTFVKDQKQSVVDVVDTITPSQIKQVAQSYKDGLNVSPKQAINETLEGMTGIDLSQGAGIDGFGNQAKEFLKGQAADLTMQLEQQILGCINTQIRDLMNKIPELDFILNFEDRINGILGNFRNKLEFKIDAELRDLAYQKFKVHQVTLFKQRIRGKIKDICPGAAPASVAEVQDFNNKVKGFVDERVLKNTDVDVKTTLPGTSIVKSATSGVPVPTSVSGMSEGLKKKIKEDPMEKGKLVAEKTAEAKAEVEQEAIDQLEKKEDETIEALVNVVPTEEDIFKPFEWENHRRIHFAQINMYRGHIKTEQKDKTDPWWKGGQQGNPDSPQMQALKVSLGATEEQYKKELDNIIKGVADDMFKGFIGYRNFKEYVDTGVDHTKSEILKAAMEQTRDLAWGRVLHSPKSYIFSSLWFEPLSYDNNTLRVDWTFRLEFGSIKKGVFRKAQPAEILFNINSGLAVSNSSPKAAIYEAQKKVKANIIELIKDTQFVRGPK